MTTLERVKELCKNRGITVKRLEEELDIPNNTIYQWKRISPSLDKIQKISDYFDVSVDYLLGRTDEKRQLALTPNSVSSKENELSADPDIRTLQRAANKMTPEERKRAITILEAAFNDLFDDEE